MKESGYDIEPIINKDRKLLVRTKDDLEFVFLKANNVITFVENGNADLGIVGKDTILENDERNYNELLDLKTGRCKFSVAAYPSYRNEVFSRKKRIATKYPKIAKKYFDSKNEDIDIVKLDGSVELGPIVGLTDAIVDIVETGDTLKANGLEVIEDVCEISTRLIGNKNSIKSKNKEIYKLVDNLNRKIKEEE